MRDEASTVLALQDRERQRWLDRAQEQIDAEKAKKPPGPIENAIGTVFLWTLGLGVFVGVIWALVSGVRWLWEHPLF